ncbi:signal peptidase I [Nocardioides cavernaquae]|uniref:Signal peptidase I n=1 Tax=Nocardioides cavernaquae TaxID=2321396 RepID=A0A3A5HEE9_9ACTN|nr:signal peptidase I [Nocardioides cavernaquae]RJS46267.1 signal peptidase I [Nocardioides cavernaquae]
MRHLLRVVRRAAGLGARLLVMLVLVAGLGFLGSRLLGYQDYVITGGSMSGTFERGSLVIEREVPVGGLEIGDVITYLPPADSGTHSLVTHRIVAITKDEAGTTVLQTKGDANADQDPWLFTLNSPTQPVVVLDVPWVGNALLALADPRSRFVILGLPACAVALLAARDLVAAIRGRGARQPHGSSGTAGAAL